MFPLSCAVAYTPLRSYHNTLRSLHHKERCVSQRAPLGIRLQSNLVKIVRTSRSLDNKVLEKILERRTTFFLAMTFFFWRTHVYQFRPAKLWFSALLSFSALHYQKLEGTLVASTVFHTIAFNTGQVTTAGISMQQALEQPLL